MDTLCYLTKHLFDLLLLWTDTVTTMDIIFVGIILYRWLANLDIIVKMYFILTNNDVMHSPLIGPHFIKNETYGIIWEKYEKVQPYVVHM